MRTALTIAEMRFGAGAGIATDKRLSAIRIRMISACPLTRHFLEKLTWYHAGRTAVSDSPEADFLSGVFAAAPAISHANL